MTQDVLGKLSSDSLIDCKQARTNMLKQQIRTWDVFDEKILALFASVPRQDFVPAKYKSLAFADISIPLSRGQSMMTPKEEARVLQELRIKHQDKMLMLGMDSGFLVTLLAKLGDHLYYIDNELDSFENLKNKIQAGHLNNVTMAIGNVHSGWQDVAPFDVIVLTGSLPSIPEILKNALSIHGRLFVVRGIPPVMEATIITRLSEHAWDERRLFETDRPRMLDAKEPETFIF